MTSTSISTRAPIFSSIVRKAIRVRLFAFAKNAQDFPNGTHLEWAGEVQRDSSTTTLVIRYRVKGAYFWSRVEYTVHGVLTEDAVQAQFLEDQRTLDPEHWSPGLSGIYFCEERLRDRLARIPFGSRPLCKDPADGILERELAQLRLDYKPAL